MTVRIRAPLDEYARRVIAGSPSMAVAWWLMASYVYYHADGIIITDGYFDELSREMLARWDSLNHPHKHLIDAEALRAGTGFHIPECGYPEKVVAAAALLLERGAIESYEPPAPKPVPPAPTPIRSTSTQLEMF